MSTFAGQEGGRAWLEDQNGVSTEVTSSFMIGRSSRCHLRLPGIQASREHALLSFDPSRRCWWLSDLDSTNGSYLNDRKIQTASRLRPGDRIRIGRTTWHFRSDDPATEMDYSLSGSDVTLVEATKRVCWLLFADVVGSTRLTRELGADEVSRRFKTWATGCEQVVENHGGFVNEFMGDGLLAIWIDQEDTAKRLYPALEEFRAYRGSSKVPFRIVLHRGEVLIGGGGPTSGKERITGADVHFVFKAEKVASEAKENGFFISGKAAEKLRDSATLQHLGDFSVPGFNEPYAFFTL